MKTSIRMIVLLLVGSLAFSGCSAIQSMLFGPSGSGKGAAVEDASAGAAVAEPVTAAIQFTFYDSFANW